MDSINYRKFKKACRLTEMLLHRFLTIDNVLKKRNLQIL
ncbi:hypothetical protein VK055_2761 [Klebsiella pneumoniae subsp. pneumoniae]|nr:hypothetical protein VK055_2761 [Klebsiella pneumoniae subsp. pneumoniae]